MMSTYYLPDQSKIGVSSPIASGGEGTIHPVMGHPNWLAKIFHEGKSGRNRKLRAMIANPPQLGPATSHLHVAWPLGLLSERANSGRCAGYLMPRLTGFQSLQTLLNPMIRQTVWRETAWDQLLRVGLRIATLVEVLHQTGYVIGDMNESNLMVRRVGADFQVGIVDTDSFQVPDGRGIHLCSVGKPEYTPAELRGQSLGTVQRSTAHDNFALGVLLFQLLAEGNHPFRAASRNGEDVPQPEVLIQQGHWPYGTPPAPGIAPPFDAVPLNVFPTPIASLFQRCFEEGHRNPSRRPTASDWRKALGLFLSQNQLQQCSCEPQHVFWLRLSSCPWCDRLHRQLHRANKRNVRVPLQVTSIRQTRMPGPTPLPIAPPQQVRRTASVSRLTPKNSTSPSPYRRRVRPAAVIGPAYLLLFGILFLVGIGTLGWLDLQRATAKDVTKEPRANNPPTPTIQQPLSDETPTPPKELPAPVLNVVSHDRLRLLPAETTVELHANPAWIEYRIGKTMEWQETDTGAIRVRTPKEGRLELFVRCKDLEGRVSRTRLYSWETRTVPKNQPPQLRLVTTLPKSPTASDSFQVLLNGSDPDGDPVYLEYRQTASTDWIQSDTFSPVVSTPEFGEFAYEFRAVDNHRAASDILRHAWSVPQPNRPPEITLHGNRSSQWTQGETLRLPIAGQDPEGDALAFEYRVNRGAWQETGVPFQMGPLTKGHLSLEFRAIDAAGNSSQSAFHYATVKARPYMRVVRHSQQPSADVPPRASAPKWDAYQAWRDPGLKSRRSQREMYYLKHSSFYR